MNPQIISSHDPKSGTDQFAGKWNSAFSCNGLPQTLDHEDNRLSVSRLMNNIFPGDLKASEHWTDVQAFDFVTDWKNSYDKLFLEVQDILACLAPFSQVIHMKGLERYIAYLKQESVLADLPFHLLPEIIQSVIQQGLLCPHPRTSLILQADPELPYLLKTHLYAFERKEKREAVETAFRRYYEDLAGSIYDLMQANRADKAVLAEMLAEPEYENFLTALNLGLDAHVSVLNIFRLLSSYLDITGQNEARFKLGNIILTKLGDYPYEALNGETGAEFVGIVDDIAKHRLAFGRYAEAERSYQIALTLWLQNELYDPDVVKHRSTALYHQLGRAVQELGRRKEAEEYFSKAFHIAKEYNDEQAMGIALRNLFRVWKAGGKQEVRNPCYTDY